jgi:hypothetical protein
MHLLYNQVEYEENRKDKGHNSDFEIANLELMPKFRFHCSSLCNVRHIIGIFTSYEVEVNLKNKASND